MTSRFVLATNHVAEIMLRWLELGDWGKAFLQVVPKRKGGVLKPNKQDADDEADCEPLEDAKTEVDVLKRKVEDEDAETSEGQGVDWAQKSESMAK